MASIRERVTADGTRTWAVLWRENGRQTSTTFEDQQWANTFRLYLEAEGPDEAYAWLDRQTEAEADQPEVLTLDTWMGNYIDSRTGITTGTRADYRRIYDRTWATTLGPLPVDAVTRPKVAAVVNQLAGRYAPKTIGNAHGLLYAALEAAVRDGHTRANPCADIRISRDLDEDAAEMHCLTEAEFAALYAEIPAHWQPLVYTMVGTGMRWQEATALLVRHVDLAAGTIRIRQAWKRDTTGYQIGPPKSRKSRRTITCSPQIVETLRPLVTGRARDAFVFTTRRGQPTHHANFYSRHWLPAVWRASRCPDHADDPNPCGCQTGLRRCKRHKTNPEPCGCGPLTHEVRVHDLRHTHVAWLIARGVGLPMIQARVGHDSITTTIGVYGGLTPDVQQRAVDAASAALSGLSLPG